MFNLQEIAKKHAIPLQEVHEQVIIEQSVKICEEKIIVIAKYPFIRDPVEFLIARQHNSNIMIRL